MPSLNEDKYIYENSEDGIVNLEIKIDPTKLTVIYIRLQEKESIEEEKYKHVIEIIPTEENGVCAKYRNLKNLNVRMNNEIIKKAKLQAKVTYNSQNKVIEDSLEINNGKSKYKLEAHPIYLSEYIDVDGISCHISNVDYAKFQTISVFAFYIFRNIEKNFFRDKELIKK